MFTCAPRVVVAAQLPRQRGDGAAAAGLTTTTLAVGLPGTAVFEERPVSP